MTGHDPDAWRRFLEFKGALVQAWKLRDSANTALDSDPRVAAMLPDLFRSEWNLAGAEGGPHRRALANRYGLELNTFYRAPPAPWKEYKITSVRDSRRGSAYHARERNGSVLSSAEVKYADLRDQLHRLGATPGDGVSWRLRGGLITKGHAYAKLLFEVKAAWDFCRDCSTRLPLRNRTGLCRRCYNRSAKRAQRRRQRA